MLSAQTVNNLITAAQICTFLGLVSPNSSKNSFNFRRRKGSSCPLLPFIGGGSKGIEKRPEGCEGKRGTDSKKGRAG